METMPYQPHLDTGHKVFPPVAAGLPKTARDGALATAITTTDWKASLPVLHGRTVTLRELTLADAPALLALLTTEEVSRFISPPPTTIAGFEKFIAWTHAQRQAGTYACFAVVSEGMDSAIGIFQVRALEPGFSTAEWGFALGSPFWGRGYFADGAAQVLAFAFDTVGVHRLEARSSVDNVRGNGALRKVGAVQEGTLRQSFFKDGRHHDQHVWTVLHADWQARDARRPETTRAQTAAHSPIVCTSRVH